MTAESNTNTRLWSQAEEEAMRAEKLLQIAKSYRIDSPAMMSAAAEELKQIKKKSRDLDHLRRTMTKPLDEAKKNVMDFFRTPLRFLLEAENIIKQSMMRYQHDEEQRRKELEAALKEQARREAMQLRKRAEAAAAKGYEEKAAFLSQQADGMPTPIVAPATPKPSGVSSRELWSAEIIDKKALIQAVAEGKVPDVVLIPDMKVLNAQARALKSALNYPGVKAVSEQVLAARSG